MTEDRESRIVSGQRHGSASRPSTLDPRPSGLWHHRFARIVAGCTLLLIAAGGMVTSTGSGLSVPDWPTSYGWNMFTFPVSKWVGGIRYEHTHRLIASTVGFLTIVLAVWTWRVEPRPWVRRLAFTALGVVIVQGLLGGITVLFFLPPAVSIGHAGLAQVFFCLTVTLALVTSPGWRYTVDPVLDPTLRRLAATTTVLIYAQIILGATMRHNDAGLAIPDFPLAFGRLVPHVWNAGVAIHFAHRVGGLIVTLAILATAGHIFYHHARRRELTRPAFVLLMLVSMQITLGAFVIWSGRDAVINTAHVVNGALVLGTSLLLTLRTFRAGDQRLVQPIHGGATHGFPRPDAHGGVGLTGSEVKP
jgi:cytochrome c oxidase assembly protein subunit 15